MSSPPKSNSAEVDKARITRRIRCWLLFFMAALIASGVTAFPLVPEARFLNTCFGPESTFAGFWPSMADWFGYVNEGISETSENYPFMFYGTDWLAFAHIMIALGFIGPLRDPVRNIWYIDFGLICCVMILPLALVCGPIRGIPFIWQLIDCSFGIFGSIPLLLVRRDIKRLERIG